MTIDWRSLIEHAGHAPSIHNSQPWRFFVRHDTVELWADRTRSVPAIDPSGRQLAVSCGAALEYLCIALAAEGRTILVTPAASPRSDLLATVRVIGVTQPDPDAAELVAAMSHRATVRDAFSTAPISEAAIETLGAEVRRSGAWLFPVVDRDRLISLTVLLQHATEAQVHDEEYIGEVRRWRRHGRSVDGVPDAAAPNIVGRHTNVALRDFNPAGTQSKPVSVSTPVDERPAIAVIGTGGDGVADWLAAGRGVARLLLRAACLGIAASPLNQVIDDPAPRQQLRNQLGLVGFPQMVLRLGYAEMAPSTGRRPVDEYLTISAD